MRSEDQAGRIQSQLLENLAGVTVSEDRVGGKIVGHRDEVSARRGFLAGAGHSGLRIGNDAAIAIHNAGRQQGRERENDRSRIAAGIRDQRGRRDLVRIRRSIPAGRTRRAPVRSAAVCGIGVFEAVDGAMLLLFQPPRAAQIDDAQTARDGLGDKFARNGVRRGQEQQLRAVLLQRGPRKRLTRQNGQLPDCRCQRAATQLRSRRFPRCAAKARAHRCRGWRARRRASSRPE